MQLVRTRVDRFAGTVHDVRMHKHTDLIIVGAGIIGAATAYRAHKQGRSIRVIDAADRPVGASIQNFGHACFTGQADEAQALADSSRRGWLEASEEVGLWAHESGTLIPAATDLEMQVLREFAEHRGPDQVRELSVDQVRAGLANPEAKVVGGAMLPRDMRVNPRESAPALASWLNAQGVQYQWNTRALHIGDGTVETTRGAFTADEVIVCPGHALMQLFPDIAESAGVRSCTLAMALIDSPDRLRHDFCMLTGTSLARYDGFTAMPSAAALKDELAIREPGLVDCIANLMVTRIPQGLLVGDSHAYSLSPEPFIDESVADLLLNRATGILGIDQSVVRQRWLGTYADSQSTNLVVERPDAKTTVAVVTSGIGMTLSFGLAELLLDGSEAPVF